MTNNTILTAFILWREACEPIEKSVVLDLLRNPMGFKDILVCVYA